MKPDTTLIVFGRSINGIVEEELRNVVEGIFSTRQLCVVPLIKHSRIKLVLRLGGNVVHSGLVWRACCGHSQKLVTGIRTGSAGGKTDN